MEGDIGCDISELGSLPVETHAGLGTFCMWADYASRWLPVYPGADMLKWGDPTSR